MAEEDGDGAVRGLVRHANLHFRKPTTLVCRHIRSVEEERRTSLAALHRLIICERILVVAYGERSFRSIRPNTKKNHEHEAHDSYFLI